MCDEVLKYKILFYHTGDLDYETNDYIQLRFTNFADLAKKKKNNRAIYIL